MFSGVYRFFELIRYDITFFFKASSSYLFERWSGKGVAGLCNKYISCGTIYTCISHFLLVVEKTDCIARILLSRTASHLFQYCLTQSKIWPNLPNILSRDSYQDILLSWSSLENCAIRPFYYNIAIRSHTWNTTHDVLVWQEATVSSQKKRPRKVLAQESD